MSFSVRWQEFVPVRLGQGMREGNLLSAIYVSFDELSDPYRFGSGATGNGGLALPAYDVLRRFVTPSPAGDNRFEKRQAYTEDSLAGLADFAEEVGSTSDSFVRQDDLSLEWGPMGMMGERRLTEAGALARAEDEALDDYGRRHFVTEVNGDAYIMTGLRLSFDSNAQCKHDALVHLFVSGHDEDNVYTLLTDERREEIQRYLVAFGAKFHAAVVSNRPRPELEAALSQSTCDAAHVDACAELVDNLNRIKGSVFDDPAIRNFDYSALIQQRDPIYSIVNFGGGGALDWVND